MRELLNRLIEAAWDAGYYAATLEKAQLTDEARRDYDRLHKEAIVKRNKIRKQVEDRLAWERNREANRQATLDAPDPDPAESYRAMLEEDEEDDDGYD